jgi:predicted phosphodiesterase
MPDGHLIGIVSDSHGQVAPLADAMAFLREKGCTALYHLGDICDSLHPETADACVGLLREFKVNCVKGNNDHAVVVNHEGRVSTSIHTQTVDYLRELPLVITLREGLMAHSLPFEKQLGLACMVGTMTREHARVFFRKFSDRILFRGHSHSPQISWQDHRGRVTSAAIIPGQAIETKERTPCIVTCGALDHGLCLLWSPADSRILSLRF